MRKRSSFFVTFAIFMVSCVFMAIIGCSGNKDKKIILTYLETMTSPSRTAVIQQIIDEYQKENPNVIINLISPPYEQADNKLTLMLNSNEPLDIVEVRDYTVKQFVNSNRLLDLKPYLDAWDETKDLLPLTIAAAETINNTPYLLPQFFFVKGLFVRTDVLQKYGITDMPKTIEDLYAVCKEVSDKAPQQFGFALRGKSYCFKISDLLILSDIDNIDQNNVYKTTNGEFSFDSPEAKEAVAKYVKMFKDSVPADGINWGFNEQVNAFISGTTPFLVQDPDTISMVSEQLDASQYTVIPMPVGKSKKCYLDYGFAGLGIPSYSEQKDEAWKFISYMVSAKKNAEFCKAYGPLPIHSSTYENDAFFSQGAYKSWQYEMSSPEYVFMKYPLDSPKYPGWPQVQEQSMQSLLLGKISVDEAVTLWKNYWK